MVYVMHMHFMFFAVLDNLKSSFQKTTCQDIKLSVEEWTKCCPMLSVCDFNTGNFSLTLSIQ